LADVSALLGVTVLHGAPGAYVNVLAPATDSASFEMSCREALQASGLLLNGVEDVEPFASRVVRVLPDPEIERLAYQVLESGEARFGTFHTYAE